MSFNFDFVKTFKTVSIISVFLICASIFTLYKKGLNLSIDFTGGVVIEFYSQNNAEIDINNVRNVIGNIVTSGDFIVQEITNNIQYHGFLIKIGLRDIKNSDNIVSIVKQSLSSSFPKIDFIFSKTDFVSPQIGKEMLSNAIIAILGAICAIILYVAIRFELKYAIGCIMALIHDTALILGFCSICSIPFDISAIAAILTVLGYSINDSVVIYDRIRGIYRLNKYTKIVDIINAGINATLTRTILTPLTVLMAVLAIILFGGHIIQNFAFIVFAGVIIGTFSSIYVSSGSLILLERWLKL